MPVQRTILLIDYDPKSIEDTTGPLRRAGYRVEVAGDGQSGLEVFGKLAPDLVLIEPMVPKKHGFQVCHEIKGTPRGKTTPVLITTAFYRGRKHRTEAHERYGCDGYLEKPIPEELLLSTCRKFLIDTQGPPLPVEGHEPHADPAEDARLAPGSVISFPELPLVEDRESEKLVALDDLSDEEIQDRLDHMIIEDAPEPAAAGPQDSLRASAPPAAAAPGPRPAAVAADAPPPVSAPVVPSSEALAGVAPRVEPATVGQPARREEPVAGAMDPVLRRQERLARPRHHAVRSRTAVAPAARSRLPLWIGVAAVGCVLAGAGLLWSLRDPAADVVETAAPQAPVAPPPATDVAREATPVPPDPVDEPAAEGPRAGADLRASSVAPTTQSPRTADLPGAGPAAPSATPSPSGRVETPSPAVGPRALPETQADRRGATGSRAAATAEATRRSPSDSAATSTASGSRTPPDAGAAPAKGTPSALEPVPAAVEAAPDPAGGDPLSAPTGAVEGASAPVATPGASRGDLVPLGEVDLAPRSLSKPAPEYPRAATQLRQEGTVTLRLLVGEDGRVERVEVESGTKHRVLQNEAIRAAERWTYEPGTKDGVAVKVWITEAVTFKL